MKPVLYEPDERLFISNGICTLYDAISCVVTEERNGAYELEMIYPVDGAHYKDITFGRIILVSPNDQERGQPFSIYAIVKYMTGTIKISAEHISYRLNNVPCAPFSAKSARSALYGLRENAVADIPFTFETDIESTAAYKQETPSPIRTRIGGVEGSILDVYGGELEWDRYTVKLHSQRGADRGVVIAYGKNLVSLEQEQSIASTLTGVYPYYYRDGTFIDLPNKIIPLQTSDSFSYPRILPLDVTKSFPDANIELADMIMVAKKYIQKNGLDAPKVSLTIQFAPIWQSEEYKQTAIFEQVRICDTVTIRFEKLGVNAKAKVVKTVFDVLKNRYSSISLGNAKQGIDTTIADLMKGGA